MRNKAIIEKEQGCFIPVIMDLKGNTLRLGSFDKPGGEVTLKKGQEFRISTNKKQIGNEHIVACDCPDLGKLVQSGDNILVDYGRNVLIVKKIEKEKETLAHLKDLSPSKEEKPKALKKLSSSFKLSSMGEASPHHSSNEEENSESSPKSNNSIDEKNAIPLKLDPTPEKSEKVSHRRKFEYAFQKKNKADKDVVVCEAVSDCTIMSSKPIFIHTQTEKESRSSRSRSYTIRAPEDSDREDEISCINVKDIKDLNLAVKWDIDSVAITGVRTRKDVEEARFILGNKSYIRIIAKIQNSTAYENFDEILKVSDGIIISRSYLSLHIPVEKLFFKQKEMIKKCHIAGKPVTIVSQVLESMILGLVPTSSEINDIANLILDGIDALTLVSETTYGLHRKEALQTLSRLCYEIEYNEVIGKQNQMKNAFNFQQTPTQFVEDAHSPMFLIPKSKPTAGPSISHTVAACVIKAVYDLQASLVVAFTQTGSTVLKISKLRSPCPILAVTITEKVARQVSLLASVTAVKVGSMFGKEGLTQKVIGIAKEKNWVKEGDFIVVAYGDVEGVSGTTNSLKIVKV